MKTIRKELNSIIYSDKDVLGGTPCFIGTRTPVKYVIEYFSLGWSLNDIHEAFPDVKITYIKKLMEVYANDFSFINA